MNARSIDGSMIGQTTKALKKSPLFATLEDDLVTKIVSHGEPKLRDKKFVFDEKARPQTKAINNFM